MSAFKNPALLLSLGIPTLAVLASIGTLIIAIARPDGELPEQYHWEGFQLDRDFDQAKQASDLNVRANLSRSSADGACRLKLSMSGAAPDRLMLILTHSTQPALDRRLTFNRVGASSTFKAPCEALPPNARWRAALSEPDGTWSIRQYVIGPMESWALQARESP